MTRYINSWNDWDPLRTLFIGDPSNSCGLPEEFPCKIKSLGNCKNNIKMNKQDIEKAKKQIENLISILRDEYSINVLRPDTIDHNIEIKTPYWNITNMNENSCPRDVFNIIGNTILEAPVSWRCRYFESLVYHEPLLKLWSLDRNSRWIHPPKQTLSDKLYNKSYPLNINERIEYSKKYEYILNEYEPVFDAADILRCGKDLFVQKGFTTNDMGIEWIRREFTNSGFRVHKMLFENNITPTHSDAEINFLRPGLLLSCPDRPLQQELINEIKNEENDWDIIEAPQPNSNKMPTDCYSSPWLSINLLSIDENNIIVEKTEKDLIKLLELEYGFNVIPVDFRDAYLFGGSFHCQSLDLYRDGSKKSYFPYYDRLYDK